VDIRPLPADFSFVEPIIEKIHIWNQSESFAKREILTRIVSVVSPIFSLLTGLYHVLALIKLPVAVFKVSIGLIPIGNGKHVSDHLSKHFDMKEMAIHVYKFFLYTFLLPQWLIYFGIGSPKSLIEMLSYMDLTNFMASSVILFREKRMSARAAAQLSAEHLAKGSLSGGGWEHNGKHFRDLGEHKLDTLLEVAKTQELPGFKAAFVTLKSLEKYSVDGKYQHCLYKGKRYKEEVQLQLQNSVSTMSPGKEMCLPFTLSGKNSRHAIAITIGRNANGTYKLRVFNEGYGIGTHHESKFLQGNKKHCSVLEYDEIELASFSKSNFFSELLTYAANTNNPLLETTKSFYQTLLPSLQGKKSPPSKNRHFWSSGQAAGSCSTKPFLALVRSKLNKQEWVAFKETLKLRCLQHLYDRMKVDGERSQKVRIVAQEIVKKLKHHYQKCGKKDLPEKVKAISEYLKMRKKEEATPSLLSKIQSLFKVVIRMITLLFQRLKAAIMLTNSRLAKETLFEDAASAFSKWKHKVLRDYLDTLRKRKNHNQESVEELEARCFYYKQFLKSEKPITAYTLHGRHLRTAISVEMFQDIDRRTALLKKHSQAQNTKRKRLFDKLLNNIIPKVRKKCFHNVLDYEQLNLGTYYPDAQLADAIKNLKY